MGFFGGGDLFFGDKGLMVFFFFVMSIICTEIDVLVSNVLF